MRARILAAAPLIGASLANLPVVYALVASGGRSPAIALSFGFVAMGLAWGGGFLIEGRRRWFSILTCVAGAAELVIALTSFDAGPGARPFLVASGALSIVALALILRQGAP